MARGNNKWIGPIVEEALLRAEPGVWCCEIPLVDEKIDVSIVKSEEFGPYLIVAGGKYCRADFKRLVGMAPMLTSGVLICVEYADDAVPALDAPELRTIVDEADEVIVTGPAGCVVWDRLSNKRYRAIDEMDILSEVMSSMQKLNFLSAKGIESLVDIASTSPTQSATRLR